MSDTNTPATPAQPAAIPQVNVEEIVAKVTEAALAKTNELATQKAEEISSQRLREVGRQLTGEQPVSRDVEVLRNLAERPTDFFQGLYNQTNLSTKAIVEQALAEREVTEKFTREYPELQASSKAKIVSALAKDKVASGVNPKKALEEAFNETVKEFDLKSVSNQQREAALSHGVVGGFAGVTEGARKKREEIVSSGKAFIEARKKQMAAFKNKG